MIPSSMEQLGAIIKQKREAMPKGKRTQEEFAELADIGVRTLQRAEKGIMGPKVLAKVTSALGLRVTINLEPVE